MITSSQGLAFLFPGQGSQHPGMLSDWTHNSIATTFEEASDTLGEDLWHIAQNNPDDKLNQTAYTQPILLAASVALWRAWQALGHPMPQWLAGHSLGEYSALVCADAMRFADGLQVVQKRGQFMQAAVPTGEGAMAVVIGLSDDTVTALCENITTDGQTITAANFNAPGQVVVAGHATCMPHLKAQAKEAGAKLVKQLPMSVPSHCPMMRDAAEQLHAFLENITIQPPTIPVIHNATVAPCEAPEDIRAVLKQQLFMPVNWVACINYLKAQGITHSVECGPGKVLCGLNKRIDKAFNTLAWSEQPALDN